MKSSLLFLVLTLCASVSLAEPPVAPANKVQDAAAALVNKQLVAPLKRAEGKRNRFSRAAPVAVLRRVRVLDAVASRDLRGAEFVRFAIDVRRGWDEQGVWQKDSLIGCAYLNEREVFVQRGAAYMPARSLLGEQYEERPGVCRAAPEGVVQVAKAAP